MDKTLCNLCLMVLFLVVLFFVMNDSSEGFEGEEPVVEEPVVEEPVVEEPVVETPPIPLPKPAVVPVKEETLPDNFKLPEGKVPRRIKEQVEKDINNGKLSKSEMLVAKEILKKAEKDGVSDEKPKPMAPKKEEPKEEAKEEPKKFSVMGFDDSDMYASATDPYGLLIPVSMQQDYSVAKSLGKLTPEIMSAIKDKKPAVLDSAVGQFDPSAKGGLMELQKKGEEVKPDAKDTSVEVHMVYAEWCGHSRNAKPAFKKLTEMKKEKTSEGLPLRFVMTEEKSPGFSQFKGKVRGFPTFMVVVKNFQ